MRVTYVTLFIILILPHPGCARSEAPDGEPLTDDIGRQVVLNSPPKRVVTLAPSVTEMVFAAGAGDKLVGVGMPDDFPPATDTLPRYSTYPLDYEAVAALEPDLALATDQVNSPRDAETLEALGIPTYFLSFRSLEDVFEGLITVGELLGTEEAAASTADSLRREVAAIRRQINSIDARPNVLFLIGRETLFSFGNESYVHEMIEAAGARSITSELDVQAPVLSEEYVLRRKPDVIMGPWGANPDVSTLLQHHPSWSVVPAIRNGRVYGIDPSLVTRPGPRLIAGIRQMAGKLHPTVFVDNPDLTPTP